MDYDAYGRLRGNNGEPSYFGGRDSDYTSTGSYSAGRESDARYRTSPLNHGGGTGAPDRVDPSGYDAVPPEVIAAITEQVTEKVKRELAGHLKQTGSLDDQPKADPMQRQTSNRSSSTSSPHPTMRKVYTPPSPSQPARTAYASSPSMEHTRSPPRSPLEKPNANVRFSDREPRARPARTFSTADLSTIDQKWGRLVDSEGVPTQRLGQFLRGLANHIINDFQPKKSIVITPEKMAAYYSKYSLHSEPHPLLSIFRAQANEQISLLYRDMGCQHFFVQEDVKKEPVIPALTPLGFAHWMTMIILAYPEEESERLGKVVLDLPIDADGQMVDGKPERLPKQLSRHLLPASEDRDSKRLVDSAMATFLENLGSTTRRKGSIEDPPISRHASQRTRPVEVHQATKTSPNLSSSQNHERERKPYSGEHSNSSDGGEPVKIERERQPYTAQPGSGKVYADSTSGLGRAASTSGRRKNPESQSARHSRTQSSSSSNHFPPPPTRTRDRRPSSPPLRNFSHSTPTDIDAGGRYAPPPPPSSNFTNQQAFSASSYGSGTSPSFAPPPPPIDIRTRRPRDDRDYSTRATDEEGRFMAGEFSSPRDAERWDRYHESRSGESDRFDKPYERGSVTIDPVDLRGAPAEDWYRDKGRGQGYYGTRSGY